MAINLLEIQPHQISRDLSGYITYIYGAPKVGKTTLGAGMPKPLLLAFERGYNALAGIMAQDIMSWSDIKQVVRELKKPEVKEKFSANSSELSFSIALQNDVQLDASPKIPLYIKTIA